MAGSSFVRSSHSGLSYQTSSEISSKADNAIERRELKAGRSERGEGNLKSSEFRFSRGGETVSGEKGENEFSGLKIKVV